MDAIKTFKTRKEAREEVSSMKGWTTKIVKMYLPVKESYTEERGYTEYADQWVIQCDEIEYLRENGYVN